LTRESSPPRRSVRRRDRDRGAEEVRVRAGDGVASVLTRAAASRTCSARITRP
jgi:hypothetical protein